jgi:deazaflavin-dependent oxidoreductase (nitroreductase family)
MDEHQEQQPLPSAQGWVREHAERYVATNGEDGHLWRGYPTLVLDTIGRKSGRPRRQMLIYGEDSGNYIIVASKGGADENPLWYENLVAHPEVQVQVRADRFTAHARTATPDERARLWPLMVGIYPPYAEYQTKTSREIPVVILERA